MNHIDSVIDAVVSSGAWKATKFISEKFVVRVTRRRYIRSARDFSSDFEFVVHAGQPNYSERAFISLCKKAKEPFPLKKIQLRQVPKRK